MKANLTGISKKIDELHTHLTGEHPPEHFSMKQVTSAFMGSLLVGLTFMFKGILFNVSLALKPEHLFLIIFVTLLLLTAEIYYIGYARVKDKSTRLFGQFWLKRIATYYSISLFIPFLLVYIYGLNNFAGALGNVFKLVIAVSLPCALGAALAGLLGRY